MTQKLRDMTIRGIRGRVAENYHHETICPNCGAKDDVNDFSAVQDVMELLNRLRIIKKAVEDGNIALAEKHLEDIP